MIAFYENRDEQLFIGEMTHIPFPVHVHNQAEILAVVSGTVRFTVDDTEYTLLPGDVAFVFPLTPTATMKSAPMPPEWWPSFRRTSFRNIRLSSVPIRRIIRFSGLRKQGKTLFP